MSVVGSSLGGNDVQYSDNATTQVRFDHPVEMTWVWLARWLNAKVADYSHLPAHKQNLEKQRKEMGRPPSFETHLSLQRKMKMRILQVHSRVKAQFNPMIHAQDSSNYGFNGNRGLTLSPYGLFTKLLTKSADFCTQNACWWIFDPFALN